MSITITGETLYEIQYKLGLKMPSMGIDVVRDGNITRIRIRSANDSRSFVRSFEAARFLRRQFDKKIKELTPKPPKVKRAKRRR